VRSYGSEPGYISFSPTLGASAGFMPTLAWAGNHRLLALARASNGAGYITPLAGLYFNGPNPSADGLAIASIAVAPSNQWQLYDLGVITLRASEAAPVNTNMWPLLEMYPPAGNDGTLDINALYMLPDSSTWFLNPTNNPGLEQLLSGELSSVILLDDIRDDQLLYGPYGNVIPALQQAPSPIGTLGGVPAAVSVSQFSRGLVPQPDPKNGMPIISVLAVAASTAGTPAVLSLNNAQVAVQERTRYILP
jgi:hypothetical protein